jgi:hypothetical protein
LGRRDAEIGKQALFRQALRSGSLPQQGGDVAIFAGQSESMRIAPAAVGTCEFVLGAHLRQGHVLLRDPAGSLWLTMLPED